MEVKKLKQSIKVEKEKFVLYISEQELKQIILDKIKETGYRAFGIESIFFLTGYKYVEDEWGMNQHQVSFFKGVEVELKGE